MLFYVYHKRFCGACQIISIWDIIDKIKEGDYR